jgi:hypothetical protein
LKIIHKRNKSPFYKTNYKNEEDYKNYQSLNKRLNEEEYSKYIKNLKYSKTINYYIEKYGEKEGEIKWKEMNKKKDSMSLKFWLSKYDNDYKKAIKRHKERIAETNPSIKFGNSNYSKSSILFFDKIINELKLNKDNILYSDFEYCIYYTDQDGKNRRFFYDFTDLDNKIIIEYNGLTWHPSEEKMSIKELKLWKNPYDSNLSYEEVIKKDKFKEKIAIEKGFKFIKIWDCDNEEDNIKNIIEIYKKL